MSLLVGCTCVPSFTFSGASNSQSTLAIMGPHQHRAFPHRCIWNGRLDLQARSYACEDVASGIISIFEREPRHEAY